MGVLLGKVQKEDGLRSDFCGDSLSQTHKVFPVLRDSANNSGRKVCELIFRAAEAVQLILTLERPNLCT